MRWHCPKRFSLIRLYCFWRIYFRYVKVGVHCNQNVGDICLNRKSINTEFSNYYFHLKLNKAHRGENKANKYPQFAILPNLHFYPYTFPDLYRTHISLMLNTSKCIFSSHTHLKLSTSKIKIISLDFLLPQRKQSPPMCSPGWWYHYQVITDRELSL